MNRSNTESRFNKLWVRAETKPFEQRTLITPQVASQLIGHGYELVVERSEQRIFDDEEYAAAGCRLVDSHAWHNAPENAIILGLKELDDADGPFTRKHVHFAHVFKEQQGWQNTLMQFHQGGGELYDLEYLTDEYGKRVAAFGYWAGFVGAAVAVLAYCEKAQGATLGSLTAWKDKTALVDSVKARLHSLQALPNAMVMGALGRCGSGAVELFEQCGIKTTAWDQKETAAGGPFDAIREHDIFVNCVFVNSSLPPFTTLEHLALPGRRVQMISDVSCDPFGQYNPLPVYQRCTGMDHPVDEILPADNSQRSLDIIAIDHLPSLLPRESSEDFASQLLPALLKIRHLDTGAWQRAKDVFDHHIARMLQGSTA